MPKKDEVYNKNIPQFPADTHDTRYWNDARGWVRGTTGNKEPTGHDETGEDYPSGFDRGNAWRQKVWFGAREIRVSCFKSKRRTHRRLQPIPCSTKPRCQEGLGDPKT